MKTNIKALKLVEKGLSPNTVSKLTESQINILYTKLLGEQVTNPNVAEKIKNIDALDQKLTGLETKMTKLGLAEKELDEEEEVTVDPNKDTETQDPHQVGPSSDDGFGDETDGMGMFESNKGEPNPWAICHAQVGPRKSRKWERCVMSVKTIERRKKSRIFVFRISNRKNSGKKHASKNH